MTMRFRRNAAGILAGLFAWLLVGAVAQRASAGDATMKLEVQLVWGTTESTSPDPNHRPVEADVEKKLKRLFRWSNYFEVSRKTFTVPITGTTNVAVSEKFALEVRRLTRSAVEVGCIGKGKPVERRILALTKDKPLIYGGDAPGATSWFVILKRLE